MILVYACAGTALALAICALIAALSARRAYGASSTTRRLRLLEGALSELQEALDALRISMRRQVAREGMRDIRRMRKEPVETPVASADPEETRAASKRKARIELDMPENPVQAVLANLGGRIKRVK
jgi:type II secretory pathway pseudopilin PulG